MKSNSQLCLGVKTFYPIKSFFLQDENPSPTILGKFQHLKELSHPNLTEYVDIMKGKHDRFFVISEHYTYSLRIRLDGLLEEKKFLEEEMIMKYSIEILRALDYLHNRGIVFRNLKPENILLDDKTVKLADYGLFYITDNSKSVNFAIGSSNYLSPESIASISTGDNICTPKSDIWSFGVIITEMVEGEVMWKRFAKEEETTKDLNQNVLQKVIKFTGHIRSSEKNEINDLKFLLKEQNQNLEYETSSRVDINKRNKENIEGIVNSGRFKDMSERLKEIVRMCLIADPAERINSEELLSFDYFKQYQQENSQKKRWVKKPYLKCLSLSEEMIEENDGDTDKEVSLKDPFSGKSIGEIFHYWKLNGGSVEKALPKQLQMIPPILRLPLIVRVNGSITYKDGIDPFLQYDENIVPISLDKLRNHFSKTEENQQIRNIESFFEDGVLPPISVRERDIDYQRYRVSIFKELFKKLPASSQEIINQAKIDIPPVIRAEVWAIVLGVPSNRESQDLYNKQDKESKGRWDHQIEVDVPRCHQYHHLLSSFEGHQKFKRVLKAWVYANPNKDYWQGLDSLTAPLLTLNFNNEARAFCCLQSIVDKFSKELFDKENTLKLQKQLVIFRQLVAFHDPELAVHLHKINFNSELFAIPWYLTLFSHMFPLKDIYKLWDFLLLGFDSLPHFISTSIMLQLRDKLMTFDFNSCIVFFSNLPELDIDSIIKDTKRLVNLTPASLSYEETYSDKYIDTEKWWESPIPFHILKEEMVPRISLKDFIMRIKKYPSLVTVIDIRAEDEFKKNNFPGSVHVNTKKINPQQIEKFRGTYIFVIAKKGKGTKFCNHLLLDFKLPYVCILNGGIDRINYERETNIKKKSFLNKN